MPISASATPKRWPFVDGLGAIPPLLLFVGLALIYLPVDHLNHGPARQAWERLYPDPGHWVALVREEPITQAQLDLAIEVRLASRGLTQDTLPRGEFSALRDAALSDLIDASLLRQEAAKDPQPPPSDWVERGLADFQASFAPGNFREAIAEEELDADQLHALLTAHYAQVAWLDRHTAPAVSAAVSEAEVKRWFEAHATQLADPETIRARHLFLSTVEVDIPEREQLIRDLHGKLERGEATLATLAAQYSEDERTKRTGGDLGYFSRERLPRDFTDAVFALQPGQRSAPFRTKIGWHIVEVIERLPARPARWDDPALRAEIELHLRNEAKRQAVADFIRTLDRSGVTVFR